MISLQESIGPMVDGGRPKPPDCIGVAKNKKCKAEYVVVIRDINA